MQYLNNNACRVLRNIPDRENDRGFNAARGMTRKAIFNNCNANKPSDKQISLSTVTRALKVLEQEEFIKEGIKIINVKTYFITDKGFEYLNEIKKRRVNNE